MDRVDNFLLNMERLKNAEFALMSAIEDLKLEGKVNQVEYLKRARLIIHNTQLQLRQHRYQNE